jgi:hypothetical protein
VGYVGSAMGLGAWLGIGTCVLLVSVAWTAAFAAWTGHDEWFFDPEMTAEPWGMVLFSVVFIALTIYGIGVDPFGPVIGPIVGLS